MYVSGGDRCRTGPQADNVGRWDVTPWDRTVVRVLAGLPSENDDSCATDTKLSAHYCS